MVRRNTDTHVLRVEKAAAFGVATLDENARIPLAQFPSDLDIGDGVIGPPGADGAAGPAGPGVPAGGTPGDIVTRIPGPDYSTGWTAPLSTKRTYNIMDYGAVGEGDPADAAADLAAWNAVNAQIDSDNPATGGRIRIPGGVFYVPAGEKLIVPSFRDVECDKGCTYWVRTKGSTVDRLMESEGFGVGTPCCSVAISGLTLDGNYVKYYDGVAGPTNPAADPFGGAGSDGLCFYGEDLSMQDVEIKCSKGTGLKAYASVPFGPGVTKAGYQFHLHFVRVVESYGTYNCDLGCADSEVVGLEVIKWDDVHLVTPGAPFPATAVGSIGLVLSQGGQKIIGGHVWGEGHWRAVYDFSGDQVVTGMTMESARNCQLWWYGGRSEFTGCNLYCLNPTIQPTSKGLIVGSDGTLVAARDVIGNTFTGSIKYCQGGAVDWQRGTANNRVDATVWQAAGGVDLTHVPDTAPYGGPTNRWRLRVTTE